MKIFDLFEIKNPSNIINVTSQNMDFAIENGYAIETETDLIPSDALVISKSSYFSSVYKIIDINYVKSKIRLESLAHIDLGQYDTRNFEITFNKITKWQILQKSLIRKNENYIKDLPIEIGKTYAYKQPAFKNFATYYDHGEVVDIIAGQIILKQRQYFKRISANRLVQVKSTTDT